jgi:large subunit ribosomal protein L17
MRHRKKTKKLGRTSAHRKATLRALSAALIREKRITTTVPKAKALRPFIEPLITRAKTDTHHNRQQVFRHLQNKEAIKELFGDVAVQVGDRPGGYTRIIKLGPRPGDSAEMAVVELVDYNDVKPEGTGSRRKRTRRGGGGGRRRKRRNEPQQEAGAGA